MRGCDLVITGEGRLDHSSREGKAPICVSRMAKKLGIPCVAVVGSLDKDVHWLKEEGIAKVFSLFDAPLPPEDPRKLEVPARLAEIVSTLFQIK